MKQGWIWCVAFFVLGPSLILVNSHVFNRVHYRYPVLFSSLGIWGTALVSQLLHRSGLVVVRRKISFEFWLRKVVPIGLLSAACIGSGNAVYLHLSVSFTQMLKALTPVYILMCLVVFGVEIPRAKVVLAVIVISLGTVVASLGEVRFSWTGFLLQSLADFFEGSRLVLLQIIMTDDALSPVESMFFTSPATAVCQLLLVLVYEEAALTNSKSWELAAANWPVFVLATLLGVAINFVGVFVIKQTSGLMLKLLGVIRNNCLVIFSVLFMGEATTALQMTGYVLSVAGFVWYTNLTQASKKACDRIVQKREYTRVIDQEAMDEL